MNQETNIIGRALLVRLNISQFVPTRKDNSATAEVLLNKHAAKGSAEVRKHLLPKEATEPIAKLAREIRADFYKHTLPWHDEGVRLLPTDNWLDFTELMATHRSRFDDLVGEFVKQYSTFRQASMQRLGLLFDNMDYPDVADVASRFALRTNWSPLPKSEDFRLTLNKEDMDDLTADLESKVAESVAAANKDLYDRLSDKLSHVAAKLADPDSIFRDSMIEGLRELCRMLPKLNVTGDEHLTALAADASALAKVDPQDLRDDDDERDRTRREAEAILARMGINIPAEEVAFRG